MALWGGRFTQEADARFKSFNDSLVFDYRMAKEDIEGSIGWAKAIASVGIITNDELTRLLAALQELLAEVNKDPHSIANAGFEDIHSYVESKLIDKVGDLGKKLHTGRSRNDQVATDLKLWCKAQVKILLQSITGLEKVLVGFAGNHFDTVIPGYTHLQRAQPVTFGHWAMAYVEMFDRDYHRLTNCQKMMDTCPLGSAALAGTAYPIDREILAGDLGFARATRNSLDSVSDRDHVLELLSCASISMVHLSRMAEDIIFYNSGESAFFELSDKVTSGSSLMPQKKNPDACELIRGKSGRVFGSLMGMLATLKGLPLAYNKDMQEDKESSFDAIDTLKGNLKLFDGCIATMRFRKDVMAASARNGFTNATDAADYLVTKGVPFRDAHGIVGALVLHCIEKGCALDDLTLDEFRAFSDRFDEDIHSAISLQTCVEKRLTEGAPGRAAMEKMLREAREYLS